MTQIAMEPPVPAGPGVPAGVLGNPPATEVGAAEAFALAIQLAMGVVAGGAAPAKGLPQEPVADEAAAPETGDEAETETETAVESTDPVAVPLVAALLTPAPVLPTVAAPVPTSAEAPTPEPREAAAPLAAPSLDVPEVPTEAPKAAADVAPATGASDDGAPLPTPTQPSPAAPTAPVEASAGPAPVAAAPRPEVARPVVAQVIPEVTKLFDNGDGVQRVTLELNPKALGEVRVVLTVRHGDVHVRLAAGTEAREALAHSSHELTRALEQIGVKEHRLTLAELPAVSAASSTQTHADTAEQQPDRSAPFTGHFDTRQHHGSPHPRTGADSTATDGTDHDHGTRSRGDRSIHEVSHVPSRGGVDLRM